MLPYDLGQDGVFVSFSFLVFTISYRYNLSSEACRTNISILYILYLSSIPSAVYTGKANLDVKRYHPYAASIPCLILKFFCQRLLDAYFNNPIVSVVALAFAFALVPLSLLVSSEPFTSLGKSFPI